MDTTLQQRYSAQSHQTSISSVMRVGEKGNEHCNTHADIQCNSILGILYITERLSIKSFSQ